ncbi:hypothetical protein KDA14_02650 [Candidatus Saccharibacteria bacterium]|nr:hypothetical protein [Candidatus Saccharibacteria bacterium]
MWFGAHQKIDRLARRKFACDAADGPATLFPETKQILQFEGHNGPDAIKRKTPAQDEPWHYYDPYDETDTQILDIIAEHYKNLVAALREENKTRASFEAAWLAHAVVDGLTPAHHYPYEKELQRLRGGKGIESRTTAKEKILMPGDTMREKLRNNWQMWGDKGLLATHIAFEAGVALVILPLRFTRMRFQPRPKRTPYLEYFKSQATIVADLKLYEQFYVSAWTPKLAKRVRRELVPVIVSTVAYIWQSAAEEAYKKGKST